MSLSDVAYISAFVSSTGTRGAKELPDLTFGGGAISLQSYIPIKRTTHPCARKHISVRPSRQAESGDRCLLAVRPLGAELDPKNMSPIEFNLFCFK